MNHDLELAVRHAGAAHRHVGDDRKLVLAIVERDQRVHRAARRREFSPEESGGCTEGANQDALVVLGNRLINDERRVRRTARIALALQHLAAVGIGVIDAVRGEVSGELHHQLLALLTLRAFVPRNWPGWIQSNYKNGSLPAMMPNAGGGGGLARPLNLNVRRVLSEADGVRCPGGELLL